MPLRPPPPPAGKRPEPAGARAGTPPRAHADESLDDDSSIEVHDDESEVEMVEQVTPKVTGPTGAPTILVVDDDADIRKLIIAALSRAFTIYEAEDGERARVVLGAIPAPDGIVCDIMMPKLDGLALARILRKDPILQRIPILFLTAKGGAMDVVTGINAGARHYVTKPFKLPDLLAKVQAMTKKR